MGCTHTKPQNAPSTEALNRPAYIKLNPEKTLIHAPQIFGAKGNHKQISFDALQGKYSYCVIENKQAGQAPSQYLLLNLMQDEESNHGCFELFKRKVPGYNNQTSRIIVGGEITFAHNITWNVKSATYSMQESENNKYGDFDTRNTSFEANLTTLWMPGQYQVNKSSNKPEESPTIEVRPHFFSAQPVTPHRSTVIPSFSFSH